MALYLLPPRLEAARAALALREIIAKGPWYKSKHAPAIVAGFEALETRLAEAYQVVGSLAMAAGLFDSAAVTKALDCLSDSSDQRELLPFGLGPEEDWPLRRAERERDAALAVVEAARELCRLVQMKGLPWSHAHNVALRRFGLLLRSHGR